MKPTQPLRDEHKELFPHLELLRDAADSAGVISKKELKEKFDKSLNFLINHLIPHAKAEDKALYPVVEKMINAPGATKTMSRDHVEVVKLTKELKTLGNLNDIKNLQRVLYGLYTLIKVHFSKEEEIYLPLLDKRLNKQGAKEMFENMEKAARKAKIKKRI